ncbi:uncharacterized protein LOC126794806 [Argentina anserina]|uniref:uncharacterized protein LOC126794806 n=1 Tax=Argentina anserina TaxID=57926 RepID=UPI0021764241|nr:uncharacterized protein LOC126794806 [Potentilla anserina]
MMGDMLKRATLETAVWAGKLLLLCVGIVSTMVFLKVVIIPYLLNLTLSTLPNLWTSIRSYCLSPLYIYIIVNFIILIIVASSIFQNQKQNHPSSVRSSFSSINNLNNGKTTTSDHEDDYCTVIDGTTDYNTNKTQSSSRSESTTISPIPSLLTHQFSNEMISWHDIHIVQQASTDEESIHRTVSGTSSVPLERFFSTTEPSPEEHSFSEESCLTEKPATEEEVEDNTLDTTWNAIMERQGKPICKHLKKSETWDTPPRTSGLVRSSIIPARELVQEGQLDDDHHENISNNYNNAVDDRVAWARKELRKSDTFSDRVSMIREKSMSQDELKQRAEAFINKINNQMRLQRLESDQRFREMVNRGL